MYNSWLGKPGKGVPSGVPPDMAPPVHRGELPARPPRLDEETDWVLQVASKGELSVGKVVSLFLSTPHSPSRCRAGIASLHAER